MDLLSGKKIHEGKFSIVFLVDHKGEKFIVKQLHPRWNESIKEIDKFKTEALLPYLKDVGPKTLDYKEYIGNHYIVREYLAGVTLKDLHSKFVRKKYHAHYMKLYIGLCEKLMILHENGMIHGDIKPSNILWMGEDFKKEVGEIRLLDMGLSLKKDHLPVKSAEPLYFSMMYGAPELMLNEPQFISELTDLFSTGICMYESFSSDVAYHENHPAVLLQMMLSVPLKKKWKIPQHVFNTISILTTKPGFKKPIAGYHIEEVSQILKESLVTRAEISTAEKLREKLMAIS